jgi:sterol 3beta-glucosyltransferase
VTNAAIFATSEVPHNFFSWLTCGCRCLNKLTYEIGFRIVWGNERDSINKWRMESLGLKPINDGPRGIFETMVRLRIPAIVACSTLVCGPRRVRPGDCPPYIEIAGFPFVPGVEETGEAADTRLVAFLARAEADGTPVIYLGLGSMPAEPASLVALAAGVCKRLRCRAVIVAGWSGADAELAGTNGALLIIPQAQHEWLFARVHCIVHHCGIGTTAAALRSGTPQVPAPFMLDQPFNAATVVKLGCAPAAAP